MAISLPQSTDCEGWPNGWDGYTSGGSEYDAPWRFYASSSQEVKINTTYKHGGSKSIENHIVSQEGTTQLILGYPADNLFNTKTLYVRYWFRSTIPWSKFVGSGPKLLFAWEESGDHHPDGVMTWGSPGNWLRWQWYQWAEWHGEMDCSWGGGDSGMATKVYVTGKTSETLHGEVFDGNWHKFEFYFELESTPSADDGKFWFKIDDALIAEYEDVDYVASNAPAEECYFSQFKFGGNWSGADPDGSYYIDDVFVDDAVPAGGDLLTTEERIEVWRDHMEGQSNLFAEYGDLSKHDLFTAIGETDQWIEDGRSGDLVDSLSEPCKSELTSAQITDLDNRVTAKRG